MLKNKEIDPVILPLTMDGIFKMYFEDPRNLTELRNFLKAGLELCDDDLSEIEVINPGLLKDHFNDKGFTVDLLLKTKFNNDIHVEMQANPHENFNERVQLYNARKAGQQIKVGGNYSDAKRTISLIVTDFRVFDDSEEYHEKIIMRRENGKVFTNVQEINIIDLSKLGIQVTNERRKFLWGKLFKARTKEDLEMLAKESEEMEQAVEKLIKVSADERAQAYALSRDNAEYIRKAEEYARKKRDQELAERDQKLAERDQQLAKRGQQLVKREQEIGEREKKAEEEKLKIAKMLINNGVAIDIITNSTGLSRPEILKLKDQL